jgi:PBP1b-binding outer membrane lipoprotein LpoB
MSNRHRPALRFRSGAIRGLSAVVLGALVLSGCSGEDDAYAQFCESSRSLTAMSSQTDSLVPDQDALAAVRDGDFTALNSWGDEAQETVADVGAKFEAALDEAPDEDVAGALETYLAMLDVFQQMAIASAEADDTEDFSATLVDLNEQGSELADSMTEAGNVLATTQQIHCE